MKIILDASDITAAMVTYVENMGINLTNKDVETAFNVGRGANTHTVTLDINPSVSKLNVPAPVVVASVVEVEVPVETPTEKVEDSTEESEPAEDLKLFNN